MTKYRVALIAVLLFGLGSITWAQENITKPDTSGYVNANGTDYWFEIRGKGEPLLLLHGGLMSAESFGPVLIKLAESHRVIGIDLLGHGHTALGSRKIIPAEIGNDLARVLEKLGIQQVNVMGYSFGGAVALQLAFQHPSLVHRLVLVSTPYSQDGWFAEMLPQQAALSAAMADQMKETPIYKSYVAIAPDPKDFPRLLDAMGEFMRQPYDWSENVKQLKMPVMLVYGDADMVRPEHYVSFYHLLGGGLRDAGWMRELISQNRMAILPDVTHYEMGTSPKLASAVLPFLNGKMDVKSGK